MHVIRKLHSSPNNADNSTTHKIDIEYYIYSRTYTASLSSREDAFERTFFTELFLPKPLTLTASFYKNLFIRLHRLSQTIKFRPRLVAAAENWRRCHDFNSTESRTVAIKGYVIKIFWRFPGDVQCLSR